MYLVVEGNFTNSTLAILTVNDCTAVIKVTSNPVALYRNDNRSSIVVGVHPLLCI